MHPYLSGPMTGYADDNFPAFNTLASALRAAGHQVVNPAEIDPGMPQPPKEDRVAWMAYYHACLRADVRAMMDCEAIALMPGWTESNGAHLELHLAHRVGMRVVFVAELLGAAEVPCTVQMVPADCAKALDYYRAGVERRAPQWVPSRVLLVRPLHSDFPMTACLTTAEAGEHDCESNRYGAITVRATNGQMLGIKPEEFEPLEWRKNDRPDY